MKQGHPCNGGTPHETEGHPMKRGHPMKQRESLVKGEQLQLTSTRSRTQSRGVHGSECGVGTEFLSTWLVLLTCLTGLNPSRA